MEEARSTPSSPHREDSPSDCERRTKAASRQLRADAALPAPLGPLPWEGDSRGCAWYLRGSRETTHEAAWGLRALPGNCQPCSALARAVGSGSGGSSSPPSMFVLVCSQGTALLCSWRGSLGKPYSRWRTSSGDSRFVLLFSLQLPSSFLLPCHQVQVNSALCFRNHCASSSYKHRNLAAVLGDENSRC